jgi:2-polyprenyl-6-methoxyphenol hydroxylase-like FAD-dependent oxidoreductase
LILIESFKDSDSNKKVYFQHLEQYAEFYLQRLFAHPHALAKELRQWGMKNFDTIPPLKQWVIQQAMQ